jgi:hypothetical protein
MHAVTDDTVKFDLAGTPRSPAGKGMVTILSRDQRVGTGKGEDMDGEGRWLAYRPCLPFQSCWRRALELAGARRNVARPSAVCANSPSVVSPLSIRASQLWPQLSRRQLP